MASLLALTACQTLGTTVNSVLGGPETRYACVTGGAIAARAGMGNRHMDVTYAEDGKVYFSGTLSAVTADFGKRFGDASGTIFWLNDDKALFSRPGETQLLCHRQP